MTVSVPAPGKINLFLHIVGRRADGYHLLESVFQFIDLCDILTFTLRDDDKIIVTPALTDVPLENNLIYRAAKSIKPANAPGVTITCDKKIPLGAGLGGGSSDAATTLVTLNKLWETQHAPTTLAQIGLTLGADVPFFIHGRTAFVSGIGEVITPIECPTPWYVLIMPPQKVATAEIFSAKELTRSTPTLRIPPLPKQRQNDCEAVVFKRYPIVAEAYHWLNHLLPARMTGTGAAIFAAAPSAETAQQIASTAPWPALAVKGMEVSPLL